MSYKHYKIEDFLSDPDFKNWVVNPTHHSTQYWESVGMNDKELQDKMRKARRVILKLDFSFDDPTEEEIKVSLNKVLHASPNKFDNNKIRFVKRPNWTIGVAASLLFALALSFFIQKTTSEVEPSISIVKKENPRGQKSTIMLPDGTKVILNAESTISYKNSFDSKERRVVLQGEAFFDVIRDPKRPFMVETKNLVTTALGTSFNVNAYEDQEEHVTLLTGKVSVNQVEDRGRYEILNPGERADFRDGLITKHKDILFNEVKWKDGILVFQKTPFEEGILELERWYGVSIEVRNYPENTSKNFTGIFENDNLSNVLESLGYAMRFDYEINDKSIIITFK